ncbi:MAG TPA: hypothetical protein VJP86_05515 [Vicinamibacterales bacterium]|nr:hypothetical protein [Vicinamibacterales bacterium]
MPKRLAAFILVAVLAHTSSALAQGDFTQSRVHLGDRVYVVKVDGTEVGGHVTQLTPSLLAINDYQFPLEPGLKIERTGDPLWNGIAWGVGAGFLTSLAACGTEYGLGCAAGGAVAYGIIGGLIDWAHVGRTILYRVPGPTKASIGLSPARDGRGAGLVVRLSF